MSWLIGELARQSFTLLFLTVAAGYLLGQLKVKGIGLGATASTLIVGLGFSLLAARADVKIQIPELAGMIFFYLYMFSVGMKVGPQFLVGLRRDAKGFIILGLFIPLASFGLMLAPRGILHVAPGTIPGLFAGANTATPGLGAAQAALAAKGADQEAVATMSATFAFMYSLSTVLFVLFTKVPDLLGRDLKKVARDFVASVKGEDDMTRIMLLSATLIFSGSRLVGSPDWRRIDRTPWYRTLLRSGTAADCPPRCSSHCSVRRAP